MKFKHILAVSVLVLSLISCNTMDGVVQDLDDTTSEAGFPANATGKSEHLLASPCPQVELVDDLSSISDFADPDRMSRGNLISRVDLSSAESTCKLSATSAIVDLKLIFNGLLGAKGKQKSTDKPFFTYPYFVAVTAPNGKIMAKEIFAASLSYAPNENNHSYFENLRQIIPIKSKNMANRYKILIGFQVSPEQLAYNRANMVPIENAKAAESENAAKK